MSGTLLNAFQTLSPLRDFNVWRLPVAARDLRVLFGRIHNFSKNRIADCTFNEGFLYFKGDPSNVEKELKESNEVYIGEPLEEVVLSPSTDMLLIKHLFYSAFEGTLYERGWLAPLKNMKRAIPLADEIFKENLHLKISDEVMMLFGLKYMFEVRPSGDALLWLDIYAPLWSLAERRRLHIKEIDEEIRKIYKEKALLRPKERYYRTLEIINDVFGGEKSLEIRFCDNTSVSFLKEMITPPPPPEDIKEKVVFFQSMIDESFLRFKNGYSRNPKKIVNLKAYDFGAIKEVPVKAIVAEPLKDIFLNFLRKLENGHRGNYMGWPGFSAVTGAKLSFNNGDLIELENGFSEKDIEDCFLRLVSESGNRAVILLIMPRPLHGFYHKIKARALQKRRRIQVILVDTLNKEPLEFSLLNIGIALYAKAGGTPWILREPMLNARGLFIGISFHLDHEMKNIYYGVMEVFDKYGKHLECKVRMYKSPYEEEIKSVKGLYIPRDDAKKMLNNIIEEYDPVEIIFHKSALFHREEKKAIEEVCQQHGIRCCLVHIEKSNPYRVYMPNQDYVSLRGTIIFDLPNRDRAILITTGHSIGNYEKVKTWSGIGTPKPLEITVEKNTTEYNVREIAGHILNTTKLDWNTTETSVKLPITLKYSNKAANLAPYLREPDIGLVDIADIRDLM